MKITQEEKEIVGKLVAQGQAFDMLNIFPLKRPSVPFWMNDVYEFKHSQIEELYNSLPEHQKIIL